MVITKCIMNMIDVGASDCFTVELETSVKLKCLNPTFPLAHTTNLQKTTWKSNGEKYGKFKRFTYTSKLKIIVAKGENAHYEQFLLLPQYFQMC